MSNKGCISKIQHFSLGDGPGIRTTVFMQGCNLNCPWCHNPETISQKPAILCYKTKCTLCGLCGKVCPNNAISFKNGERVVDKSLCNLCGNCEELCPEDAILISGKEMTAEEVFCEIMKDSDFYSDSGGVTFSGGEPMLQADFCAEVAKMCKDKNIHILIDTAGCVPYKNFEKVIPYCDMFYFDIKACDEEEFLKTCGGSLSLVKENLKRLLKDSNVVVRMPIIPGYNNNEEYIKRCGEFLGELNVKRADLLPFHRMGKNKYDGLGLSYRYSDTKPPETQEIEKLADLMKSYDINCQVER
ncbi:MAG: glycyl-radical enzyme activating protein [Clostridia bacterium]|nr:glycyl-radical enzyme activating protein [Clostridia bacterium]